MSSGFFLLSKTNLLLLQTFYLFIIIVYHFNWVLMSQRFVQRFLIFFRFFLFKNTFLFLCGFFSKNCFIFDWFMNAGDVRKINIRLVVTFVCNAIIGNIRCVTTIPFVQTKTMKNENQTKSMSALNCGYSIGKVSWKMSYFILFYRICQRWFCQRIWILNKTCKSIGAFFSIHFDSNLFGISSIFHSWSCKTNLPIQYFYGKCVTSTASKTCSINVWQDDKQRVCCWHFHYYFVESTKQCALVPFSPFFSIVAIFFYRLPSNERRK